MNGYERFSDDYGGPPAGWGTWLMLAIMVGTVMALVIIGFWSLVGR